MMTVCSNTTEFGGEHFPHPIVSTPEEYEEHQAAMEELCDQIESETPDMPQPLDIQPIPKDYDSWVKQGDRQSRRQSQQKPPA